MPEIKLSEKTYRKLRRFQEEIVYLNIEDSEGIEPKEEIKAFWDFDNLIDFMLGDVRETSEQIEKKTKPSKFQKALK
jgi:hypothetical protein